MRSSGKGANLSWLVSVTAALAVIGYVGYLTFVAQRPYYVTPIDSEQDYYYNARLIAAGLPGSTHHPGTPIQYRLPPPRDDRRWTRVHPEILHARLSRRRSDDRPGPPWNVCPDPASIPVGSHDARDSGGVAGAFS